MRVFPRGALRRLNCFLRFERKLFRLHSSANVTQRRTDAKMGKLRS
jgi:hypothetical protein